MNEEIRNITDREMLLLAYGALKANATQYSTGWQEIIKRLEMYLFQPIIMFDPPAVTLETMK